MLRFLVVSRRRTFLNGEAMGNTLAENIVKRLVDIGAISPSAQTKRLVDEVQAMTHDDFIPGGKTADSITNVRDAPAGNRCCANMGRDIQSGPFYCGEPATLMGDTSDGSVFTCKRHESSLRRIEKKS